MTFDKNQTHFRDCLQEKAWEIGTNLLPLDKTLPYVPQELVSPCVDLYNFTHTILADMYENPDDFGFKIDASKPDFMNKKQVEFYFWLIGGLTNPVGNHHEIPSGKFNKLIKKFNPVSVERLKKHGFVFTDKGDIVTVSNEVYPGMLVASKAIIDAGYTNYKVNCDYFMMYCDFRAFAKYKRTYEDLHFAFSDETKNVAEHLREYNVKHRILPQKCTYFFRVDYKLKGKTAYMSKIAAKNKLNINLEFAEIGSDAYKLFENEICRFADREEFAEYCRNNLKKCSNCNPNCDKKDKVKEVFGKKTFVCQPYITITDPKQEDLKHLFRLIDLRIMR